MTLPPPEPTESIGSTYADSGVDTHAGARFVKSIRGAVEKTFNDRVIPAYGGFAGMFDVKFLRDYKEPVLVTGTDGVGTKLRIAALCARHEGVGIDLVAMCSNDILVSGAKPLFFLDYIACGRLNPDQLKIVAESIGEGCIQAGAALLGGETAEHPGLMADDDYDLAGFMVGAAERSQLLSSDAIRPGDAIISIPSSGVHSNGMSLVRHLFLKDGIEAPDAPEDLLFLQEEILRPTIIYESCLRPLLEQTPSAIVALVHITGGGFYENIPRILPAGLAVTLDRGSIQPPKLFKHIQERGNISEKEMFSVFNMGTGMIAFCRPEDSTALIQELNFLCKGLKTKPLSECSVIGKTIESKPSDPALLIS